MGHRDDLLVGDLVEVLLHVQRNRRFIRVGHLDFHTAPELGLVGELTDSLLCERLCALYGSRANYDALMIQTEKLTPSAALSVRVFSLGQRSRHCSSVVLFLLYPLVSYQFFH